MRARAPARAPAWLLLSLLAAAPAAAMSPEEMADLAIAVPGFAEKCGYDMCYTPLPEHLNIHIVPHTHMELGLDFTFKEHMNGKILPGLRKIDTFNEIMSSVMSELSYAPRTFTISATAMFFHWWDRQSDNEKREFYKLMRKGKFHFVGGGWSMTDEASASYQAIIDHHTLAMRRLNATLLQCGRPLVAWQAHNFGHSKEVASLLAQMGFHGLFMSPISIHDEVARMKRKSLEFVWRGSDHLDPPDATVPAGKETDIFTHKLFDGISSPPGFCFGGLCRDPLMVDSSSLFSNILERTRVFLEDCQYRQWPNYRTHHIMVVMGGMRTFFDASRWYTSIDKLIVGIANLTYARKMPINVFYSSPACYLKAVHDLRQSFPTKQDDFFPHMPTSRSYYVGQFTSRPSLKFMLAEANALLQITKQLQVLTNMRPNIRQVEDLKWIVGVMQDHNILSGAMHEYVTSYYTSRLHDAVQRATIVIESGLNFLRGTPASVYFRCALNESDCNIFQLLYSSIVIYNPLAWPVTLPIRIPAVDNRSYIILNHEDEVVVHSRMKLPAAVTQLPGRSPDVNSELVFISRDIPPLGLTTYYIHQLDDDIVVQNEDEAKIALEAAHVDKEAKSEFKAIYDDTISNVKREIVFANEGSNKRGVKDVYKGNMFKREAAADDEETSGKKADDNFSNAGLDVNDFHSGDDDDETAAPSDESTPASRRRGENNDDDLWPSRMIPHPPQRTEKPDKQPTTTVKFTIENSSDSEPPNYNDTNYSEPVIPFYQGKIDSKNNTLSDVLNETFQQLKIDAVHEFYNYMSSTTEGNAVNNKTTIANSENYYEEAPLPDYEAEILNETRRSENDNMKQKIYKLEVPKAIEASTMAYDESKSIWKDKELFYSDGSNKIGSNVLVDNINGPESAANITENDSTEETDGGKQLTESQVNHQSNVKQDNINDREESSNHSTFDDSGININDDEHDGIDIDIVNNATAGEKLFRVVKLPEKPIQPVFNINDTFIKNKYITLHTDGHTGLPAGVSLSGGARVRLRISVGYYEADYPSRRADADPDKMDPGANNFATMFRAAKGLEPLSSYTYVSADVSELHVTYAPWAALVLRLYRDAVALEVDWTLAAVPAPEYVGKEIFIRYSTDLNNARKFYTDANGRQTMLRIRSRYPTYIVTKYDDIAGNIYPVTSKIYIEDENKNLRFSVFNDRAQGGTSLLDGEITLFIHRRILSRDADSPNVLNDVSPLRGKHYLYLSKASRNRVFEKKFAKEIALMPRIFATYAENMNEWFKRRSFYKNELSTITKRLPIGMHLLTLEKLEENTLLLRLENILEEGDIDATHQVVYIKDIFVNIRILSIVETTLAADQYLENLQRKSWPTDTLFVKNFNKFYASNGSNMEYSDNDLFMPYVAPNLDRGLAFKPQQIRTFIVTYEYTIKGSK